jgi:hypothetical protein
MDEFVNAYVDDPGYFSPEDAIEIAIERDQEANENFLASVFA